MPNNEYIASPLNYTGGKYRLLKQIIPIFPSNISTFVDLFCGGGNVGINVNANHIVLNDIDSKLIRLLQAMSMTSSDDFTNQVESMIRCYHLSDTSNNGYAAYNCDSSHGLAKYNKEAYQKLRNDFNAIDIDADMFPILMYTVIVFSFNNQIRYNSNGQYNLPVGKRDFNQRMKNKLIAFIDAISTKNITFMSDDFENIINATNFSSNDFVYADPPYLITCASYNENGGWTKENDERLMAVLDQLNDCHIRFALSNVLTHNGSVNQRLTEWASKYNVHHLKYGYANASYHKKCKNASDEVLITNY